jgi:PAS domain S-box-containing protein
MRNPLTVGPRVIGTTLLESASDMKDLRSTRATGRYLMSESRLSRLSLYGVSILVIGVATFLRLWLEGAMQGGGFMFFFVAVIVASWYGGVGPSLVAMVLSVLVSAWLFSPPPGTPPEPAVRSLAGLAVFFFMGIMTAVLSQSTRAAQHRAEALAAEAIRQREQLSATLSCIGDAVIVTDHLGQLTMMNPVAETLTGWTMGETVGLPLERFFLISDERTGQPLDNPVSVVLREQKIVGLAKRAVLTAKDGSRRPIDESAAPVRGVRGEITGAVLIFRDITEQQRTEQALREADRRKDEFLAILSHELRNPLAPISTTLDLLRQPQVDSAARDWAQSVMERQVKHLVRLVDDLLDVSRISRGKVELRPEPIDVRLIVNGAVESARPLLETKAHELTVDMPAGPIIVSADPIRLAQVIGNLLSNAAKYTPPSGRISLSVDRRETSVQIRMRDTGIGISPEMLPCVFELFTQAAPLGSESQGGLGIGLNLVKMLVELSGGRVEAHSPGLGLGSEFVVTLPASQASLAFSPQRDSDVATIQNDAIKRRIFVVDDNADAAAALAKLLQLDGHDVETFRDGLSAIQAADANPPDIALLDLGMPEIDGLEVARRLRRKPPTAAALLVAVTGWGQEADRQRTLAAGFDHHLVKPVDAAVLRALILQTADSQPHQG